jgi:hypothetical protein
MWQLTLKLVVAGSSELNFARFLAGLLVSLELMYIYKYPLVNNDLRLLVLMTQSQNLICTYFEVSFPNLLSN